MNILQDDNGNWSSMRVAFFVMVFIELLLMILTGYVLYLEALKETPNYRDLSVWYGVVTAGAVAALVAKVAQKKHENRHCHDNR